MESVRDTVVSDPDALPLTDEEMEELNGLIQTFSQEIDDIIRQNFPEALAALGRILNKIEDLRDVLSLYMEISQYVRHDVQGFDIFKSADGENWELVTDDGFGDKYNYGALRFVTTDQGMYITTANPFYGAQLYLLTNDKTSAEVPDITADKKTADWEKESAEGVVFVTSSDSPWMTVRRNGKHFGTNIENGYTIENGKVTLSSAFLNLLDLGENPLTFVFEDGTLDVIINITERHTSDEPSPTPANPTRDSDDEASNEPSNGSEAGNVANTPSPANSEKVSSPNTGDSGRIFYALIAILMLSVMTIFFMLQRGKQKE